jgi:hypothetical protein
MTIDVVIACDEARKSFYDAFFVGQDINLNYIHSSIEAYHKLDEIRKSKLLIVEDLIGERGYEVPSFLASMKTHLPFIYYCTKEIGTLEYHVLDGLWDHIVKVVRSESELKQEIKSYLKF